LRVYRGAIELVPFGGRMLVVNLIGTEEYLRSVVPCEVGKDAPDAALEAQAIAARTYLVRNLKRHAPGGFYLCDGQHCQAYGGMRYESSRSSLAVANTRGLVLTYEGVVVNAVYHANCGGRLRSCDSVWGGVKVPYLPAHPDQFGHHSPFCQLPPQSKKSKAPLSHRPEARQYEPQTDRETDAAGWNSLLLWSEAKQATNRARGHGVGMCQDGAAGMAVLGYNRNQILGFYYPGTRLARLGSSLLPSGETLPVEHDAPAGDRYAFLLKQPPITPPRIPSRGVAGKTTATSQVVSSAQKLAKPPERANSSASGLNRWFWSNRPPTPNTVRAADGSLKIAASKKKGKKNNGSEEKSVQKSVKTTKKSDASDKGKTKPKKKTDKKKVADEKVAKKSDTVASSKKGTKSGDKDGSKSVRKKNDKKAAKSTGSVKKKGSDDGSKESQRTKEDKT
ncbi:MAG TPA: SpoIID/LytB domain-containing protein, partial [Candidatus Ozemobacteraceae bacterium]|nr:SpoIID/LytB domain-containing protein [Candidatus Ozemobacteraceae bacterium]